ncbi:PASTA domain protein [Corynebacterium ciconiae DSM 44920]|uniref:PASTA domain-containing protein n=1 Tax=Corynebacterium ciconiae TaxID=227319 RepID=UPI00037845AE|nr:Stk1 family PASTA domain-containing Ser/Thr kinase [Corynebacterium ciconiae]WKD61130.1 PASTA domain protein [Corynebacterium ciconiae DSM 44920]
MTDDRQRNSWDDNGDEPTRFIPRDTSQYGREDSYNSYDDADDFATEYLGAHDAQPEPRTEQTQYLGPQGSQQTPEENYPRQYYAPLEDEQGYEPQQPYDQPQGQPYGQPQPAAYPPPNYAPPQEPKKSSAMPWIIAVVALVVLAVVVGMFAFGRDGENTAESTTTPPPVETVTETVEPEAPAPTEDPAVQQRLQEETDRLRESVESLTSEVQAPATAVPDVMGDNGVVAVAQLKARGFSDVRTVDASGAEISGADLLGGSVTRVDPPAGTETDKSTPVTLVIE